MILTRVYFNREMYGEQKGRYIGDVTFEGPLGKIALNLSPETSDKVLAICAELIVEAAKEVAVNLTAQCLESRPLLEDKND